MPLFHLVTFGCKTNQYESAALRQELFRRGWTETGRAEEADAVLVNTCAVTARAAAEVGRAARRLRRRARAGAALVLTGCAVDLGEAWTLAGDGGGGPDSPGAWRTIRNRDKHRLAARLDDWARGSGTIIDPIPDPRSPIPAVAAIDEVSPNALDGRFDFFLERFAGQTRAFLKIQDGCANHCAYCAVPRARGAPASRDPAAIVREAAALAAAGHREIVLTGINIGAYRAAGGGGLGWLARRIAEGVPELRRLRLGSVEPPAVDDELLAAWGRAPALCPHIHLPLQSGDDAVLRAMGRRYSVADFLRVAARLRAAARRPAITTDVIVGFPGEDAAAFGRTVEVCRAAGFSRLHVFPYSPRPGTPAAALRNEPAECRRERRAALAEVGRELAADYARMFIGETVELLTETANAGEARGHTRHYLPARLSGAGVRANEIIKARVHGLNAAGELEVQSLAH